MLVSMAMYRNERWYGKEDISDAIDLAAPLWIRSTYLADYGSVTGTHIQARSVATMTESL